MSASSGETSAVRYITPKDAASALGLSLSSVYSRIDAGVIVAVKVHAKKGCIAGCKCPLKIPVVQFGAYLHDAGLAE